MCFTVNKPGVCPNLIPSRAGNCEQECQTDADCAADMKCCYNGCGSSCLVPIQEDTNEIPRRPVEPVAPSHPGKLGCGFSCKFSLIIILTKLKTATSSVQFGSL